MAVIQRRPRAKIETLGDSMIINLPSKKKWSVIIAYSLCLIFMSIGVTWFYISWLEHPEIQRDTYFILGIWFLGIVTVWVLCIWIWLIFGKEEVRVTTRAIICTKKVFGIRFQREYSAQHIKNLRLTENPSFISASSEAIDIGLKGGWIAFDYGYDTIACINGVARAEAAQVLAEIVKYISQFGSSEITSQDYV